MGHPGSDAGLETAGSPLRFASVGMTILSQGPVLPRGSRYGLNTIVIPTGAKRSGEPALSEVEWGPAVSSLTHRFKSDYGPP